MTAVKDRLAAESLGQTFTDHPDKAVGSTDMAEVFARMRAVHPARHQRGENS
ncbi:hypothetical protein [Streptomyces misionensis]|uniref:hypothetical protein n=1 Tax=Streptomyces misionensis TaxID=67331 RepID=UPI003701CF6E